MLFNRAKIHFDNVFEKTYRPIGPFIVHQVGELYCEPGYIVHKHKQAVHEISLVVSGEGEFITNGKSHKVQKGTLYINRKDEEHEIISSSINPLRFFYLGFLFKDLNEISDDPIKRVSELFEKPGLSMVTQVHSIQELFMNLFTELLTEDFLADMLMESYIRQIVGLTYRLFSQKEYVRYHVIEQQDIDTKLIYDIMHYIDTQLESIERLSDLEDKYGYSYSTLSQKFTSIMGETIKAYYTKRRFEKAKDYLYKKYSVTDTASILSFKSIHAFSRAFNNNVGMSPTEFKHWAKENKE